VLRLRRIEEPDQLEPVLVLAREYGTWARRRAEGEYGIVVEADDTGLSVDVADLLGEGQRLYLAEIEGDAVGIGGLKRLSSTVGEIKRMYVKPSGRGQGVGRALLDRLVVDARELGYEVVRLETTTFMPEAQALYRSVGFVETDPYEGREFGHVPGARDIQSFMALDLRGHVGSLDGRSFRVAEMADSGEATMSTVFEYHEEDGVIWARYSGGAVVLGFLVGTRTGDRLEFRYTQLNDQGETATGRCSTTISVLDDGALRLDEDWAWESKPGAGTSAAVEIR
jgi:GNAT superfamily N-acetyltransferase